MKKREKQDFTAYLSPFRVICKDVSSLKHKALLILLEIKCIYAIQIGQNK